MSLIKWQTKFILAGALILPAAPFLYLQGQVTRRRVGLLPNAAGPNTGIAGDAASSVELLVLGESTVAGLGARTYETALAGQFARQLSTRLNRGVRWTALGRNGVTAERTIRELVPLIPKQAFDYVLVALGGNDVMKLSSPRKWRRDMLSLLKILRHSNPDAVIFLSNCPVIKLSPAIPQPINFILWQLSKLHDVNIKEIAAAKDRVYYYDQPTSVPKDFFADGIHPSETGYAEWARAMMEFFDANHAWMKR
ncbi:MAG: SGNH/GDSL hydrolase family protein [Pyrinomonadaceae bacterium]